MRVLATIATAIMAVAADSNCKVAGEACNAKDCCSGQGLSCLQYIKDVDENEIKNACFTFSGYAQLAAAKKVSGISWTAGQLSCTGDSNPGCK